MTLLRHDPFHLKIVMESDPFLIFPSFLYSNQTNILIRHVTSCSCTLFFSLPRSLLSSSIQIPRIAGLSNVIQEPIRVEVQE